MLALVLLAAQLRAATLGEVTRYDAALRDSARDQRRARDAQSSFEFSRRAWLPIGAGGGTRCEVRVGRYCWWYDESPRVLPPESSMITRYRAELLTELDALGERYPGSDWLAAMRVHYRVDGHQYVAADSAARACRATAWRCAALVGYAAHAATDETHADSAFASAVALMPSDSACAWRDISTLLGDRDRDAYRKRSCADRAKVEQRYWLLARPQLSTPYNAWQNEYNTRRVLVRLGERAATPQPLSWADDEAELVLRYGWPYAWSREIASVQLGASANIIGHDPSPSFAFAPEQWLVDSLRPLGIDAWDMTTHDARARYALPGVRRVTTASMQVARFRRGDSTIVVTTWAAADDSLVAAGSTLGVAMADGTVVLGLTESGHVGRSRVTASGEPFLVGVDVIDTTHHTLARSRMTLARELDTGRLRLSDLLVYRPDDTPAQNLDSAIVRAVPGDTVTRSGQIGLFWETYGIAAEGESLDLALSVERVDHSWIRSTRQHLKLTPVDTPIRIRWSDVHPSTGDIAPHAVAIDLGNLDAGRYRVTLTLSPASGPPISRSRDISLTDR